MTHVKSMPIVPAARVLGILYFILGAVVSCFGLILMVVWPPDSPVVTLTALLSLPLAGGLAGFFGTALACWFYNQLAGWIGGIRVELEEAAVAGQAPEEETEIPRPSRGMEAEGEGKELTLDEAGARSQDARSVSVYRIKPSPSGKRADREGAASAEMAVGEWVDLRNHGSKTLTTKGISLYHVVETGPGGGPEYRFVVTLPDCSLKPGEVLRVHSGRRRDLATLPSEDRAGAEWRTFTNEAGYVWGDRQGDTAMLYEAASREMIDWASFDPDPPEGVVLQRQGAKLVPVSAAAAGRR